LQGNFDNDLSKMIKRGKARLMEKFKAKTDTRPTLQLKRDDEEEQQSQTSVSMEGVITENDLQLGCSGMTINGESPKGGRFDIRMSEMEDLEVVLGSGSSGTVRKMLHKPTNTFVAMKIIGLDVTEEVRNKLFLELRTHHAVNHPCIVSFYGACYEEGTVRLFLECMDGSLADIIKRKTIPENLLAKITLQILKGLAYLQKELHIVHRDIKPANILWNKEKWGGEDC